MTTREAAERLNLWTTQAVKHLIARGLLPARKVGGRWVVDPADAERLAGDGWPRRMARSHQERRWMAAERTRRWRERKRMEVA